MELFSNFFQIAVTMLGFCMSGIRYLKDRKQAYFLLTCFYGCFALGSLYWTLYLLLFSETPQVFYVSEFGWVSSVIFLHLLQYTLSSDGERRFLTGKALIAPLIVVSYHSIRGLAYAQIQTGTACKMRYFHIGVLCYVAVEYVLWISGCLWPGYSISAPYCWFDLLLTGCLFALLPATGKAVQV